MFWLRLKRVEVRIGKINEHNRRKYIDSKLCLSISRSKGRVNRTPQHFRSSSRRDDLNRGIPTRLRRMFRRRKRIRSVNTDVCGQRCRIVSPTAVPFEVVDSSVTTNGFATTRAAKWTGVSVGYGQIESPASAIRTEEENNVRSGHTRLVRVADDPFDGDDADLLGLERRVRPDA